MKPVFTVYLKNPSPSNSGAHAVLYFPAAPYEVLDALDKLRLEDKDAMLWEITEYTQFEELEFYIDGSGSFYELNALAWKLSELDETQSAIFAGLMKMEKANYTIPLPRLIDLAYSTGCCKILTDALNDSQLGKISAENHSVPGVEHLPKATFEMLDFSQIGQSTRLAEKGVFVGRSMDHPGGYVAQEQPLLEVSKTLDLTLEEPDYTILLEVSHGDRAVQLMLPAVEAELDAVPQTLEEPDWLDLSWTCLDCRVPSLMDAVSDARDIEAVNGFAETLAGMDREALIIYKALLEASNSQDILSAGLLAECLSAYNFSPQISSPMELAKEKLSVILNGPEAGTLLPYVNLQRYGESLIQKSGCALTGYGLIERTDGQPIQSPWPEGGMMLG